VRRTTAALGAILALGTLAACSEPSDPSNMHTRCQGPDKVFILDDPSKGSDLFVVPNHPDCEGKQ
jgi:hypothetical protein